MVLSRFFCCVLFKLVIVLRQQHFGFVPFFSASDLSLFLETGKGLTCAGFTESVDLRPDFGNLRRTPAWGHKGWFLLVHEPEPMVCEVKWSYIDYVREECLKLCSQAFVSSNPVFAFERKAPF